MIALLSTAYLPPIQYFSKFILYEKICIEQHENYIKQTYRNRCRIYSANGALELTIPVLKSDNLKVKIKDLQIDYSQNWQKIHWRAIESAYFHSPFFEFYLDDFIGFYNRKFKFLIDFNLQQLTMLSELLDIHINIELSEKYLYPGSMEINDYRYHIHPKPQFSKPDPSFNQVYYHQVFSDKFGFIPNLSIIDLLFNEGAFAQSVLKDCIFKPEGEN